MKTEKEFLKVVADEEAFLASGARCAACGHLNVLHNEHCCTFCLIPDCRCEWGAIRED